MIVIRRLVDRRRAYTGLFLRGEPPRIFPTTDHEHARLLQIFRQDRAHAGIENDFSDYALGQLCLPASPTLLPESGNSGAAVAPTSFAKKIEPAASEPRRDGNDPLLWLTA